LRNVIEKPTAKLKFFLFVYFLILNVPKVHRLTTTTSWHLIYNQIYGEQFRKKFKQKLLKS